MNDWETSAMQTRKGHGSAALSTFDRAEGLQLIQEGSGLPGQLHGTLVPNRFSLAHLRIGRHFPAYRFVSRNVRFTARCAIIWANNICITHLTIHQATLLSQKIVISIKTRARGVLPTATVLAIYIKLYSIYYRVPPANARSCLAHDFLESTPPYNSRNNRAIIIKF